jgi:hypothetical protein
MELVIKPTNGKKDRFCIPVRPELVEGYERHERLCMILNEKTGLYENYGLWHVPFWQTQQFYLAVKLFAIAVILLVVVLFVRRYLAYRKKKQLPLWEQAITDVRQLKENGKVSAEHGKEFYGVVSVLLKKYLYDRFGYDVIGKTDTEVIEYLHNKHQDEQIVEDIKALLQGGVIIKFANAQAAQMQIEHDYVRSIAIIQRTIPEKK